MKRSILTLALAAALVPAFADAQGVDVPTAPRQRIVTVFGEEKCPVRTSPDEVVICRRRPAEEQFRLPVAVRNEQRIEKRDDVGARIGLADHSIAPDSCSAVGTVGQYGCSQGLNILGSAKKVKDVITGDTPIPDAPKP